MKAYRRSQKMVGFLMFALMSVGTFGWNSYDVYAAPLNNPHEAARRAQAIGLRDAAKSVGLSLQLEHMVTGSGNGVLLAAAPIAGIENIPASELPHGINESFAFLTLPNSGIPAGYYTMRWFATEAAVFQAYDAFLRGQTPPLDNARLQLIDQDGRVVTEFPASLQEVSSLTVPSTASRAGNFMDQAIEVRRMPGGSPMRISITIWVQCSNGLRVCVTISV